MEFARFSQAVKAKPLSDINLTPLIDVMLVLLVIFMITAPLMTSLLKIELPTVQGDPPHDVVPVMSIAINALGQRFLDEQALSEAALLDKIKSAAKANPQPEVYVQADQAVPYGQVAELLGLLQNEGLGKIAFVTQPPNPAPNPALK